ATPDAATFLSVVTIFEVERGILAVERRDPDQARELRHWLETRLLPDFDQRILQIDVAVAQRCAALHVPDPRPERDALIAATALVHGMTVVTRNTRDFAAMDVAMLNPWMHAAGSG
ncbi:MAG: type II toxin-antitoxin system VapC family toxin, partial [Allosphingosinicella sp.]